MADTNAKRRRSEIWFNDLAEPSNRAGDNVEAAVAALVLDAARAPNGWREIHDAM
jgi:hypothetical protein